MQKLLVTGASGYLAQALIPIAAERAEVIGVCRNPQQVPDPGQSLQLDITRRAAVLDTILAEKPDAIIHCAACNPGGEEADMVRVNESGTAFIAEAARKLRCRLVSVSSDTVFNGVDAPFADDAEANPIPANLYAVSKTNGEHALTLACPDAIIVRTSLIYGTDVIDRGTAGFKQRLEAGESLQLFTDVIRQPVHDRTLATHLCTLALDLVNESGTINIAGGEAASRYSFGVRMLEYWGIDYQDRTQAVQGYGIPGLPLDLRLQQDRADALGLETPGITDILGKPR